MSEERFKQENIAIDVILRLDELKKVFPNEYPTSYNDVLRVVLDFWDLEVPVFRTK